MRHYILQMEKTGICLVEEESHDTTVLSFSTVNIKVRCPVKS